MYRIYGCKARPIRSMKKIEPRFEVKKRFIRAAISDMMFSLSVCIGLAFIYYLVTILI